eukprot:11209844-Lingulodinium_polyedra.AAC.1
MESVLLAGQSSRFVNGKRWGVNPRRGALRQSVGVVPLSRCAAAKRYAVEIIGFRVGIGMPMTRCCPAGYATWIMGTRSDRVP